MNKSFLKKSLTATFLSLTPYAVYASAESSKRGFLELIGDFDNLFKAGAGAGYSLAMMLGVFLSIAGIAMFALAGRTQDQSKTKSIAAITLVCGIALGSITGIMNMGSVELTDQASEYATFNDE